MTDIFERLSRPPKPNRLIQELTGHLETMVGVAKEHMRTLGDKAEVHDLSILISNAEDCLEQAQARVPERASPDR